MTLSDINRLCPAPEGMGWEEDEDFDRSFKLAFADGVVYLRKLAGLSVGQWQLCAERVVGPIDECISMYPTEDDLPTSYLRALAAVSLAPDPEKEHLRQSLAALGTAHDVAVKHIGKLGSEVAELRRRLAWSEEVPTEAGGYAVDDPTEDDIRAWMHCGGDCFQWKNDDGNYCREEDFTAGARFLPLANLKET